mgnify:FL=1
MKATLIPRPSIAAEVVWRVLPVPDPWTLLGILKDTKRDHDSTHAEYFNWQIRHSTLQTTKLDKTQSFEHSTVFPTF